VMEHDGDSGSGGQAARGGALVLFTSDRMVPWGTAVLKRYVD
jgi:hypothetical protein